MATRRTHRTRYRSALALVLAGALMATRSDNALGGVSSQGVSSQGVSSQGVSSQGVSSQGVSSQGVSSQGVSSQGVSSQGVSSQGVSSQGVSSQGVSSQGVSSQGVSSQGVSSQGVSSQGVSSQGVSSQGVSSQGVSSQGVSSQGVSSQGTQLRGIDRVSTLLGPLIFRGISRADVAFASPPTFQGLQSGAPFNFVQIVDPMANVRLQRGTTSSATDIAPGSYIYVPGLPATTDALKGTFWNMVLTDTCTSNAQCPASATCTDGACVHVCTSNSECTAPATCVQGSCSDVEGGIPLYIADIETDSQHNSSKYPSNDDVYLYTVYYRQPGTGQWAALCPTDAYGKAQAMAVPLDPNDWTSDASRAKFAFACTASGVAAKCARNWGYKPWKTVTETVWNGTAFVPTAIPLAPFYDACLIAARADYCQDDHSYTKNGTLVDLFDTLDGFTSINATAGLPYAPYSDGVMLHEEYQISALAIDVEPARPALREGELQPRGSGPDVARRPGAVPLVSSLRRSGMESSRYADLDPGRIVRGRALHRSLRSQGAVRLLPRREHVSAAVRRVPGGELAAALLARRGARRARRSIRCATSASIASARSIPPAAAIPERTFYPGSLVWDQRCTDHPRRRSARAGRGPASRSGRRV